MSDRDDDEAFLEVAIVTKHKVCFAAVLRNGVEITDPDDTGMFPALRERATICLPRTPQFGGLVPGDRLRLVPEAEGD